MPLPLLQWTARPCAVEGLPLSGAEGRFVAFGVVAAFGGDCNMRSHETSGAGSGLLYCVTASRRSVPCGTTCRGI
jgi:hypothetical protein